MNIAIRPYANLHRADLSGANLRDADLSDADLSDANLRGADLRGADLRDADLRGADLRGADLRDANLSGADLRGADLRDADLRGANLIDADLRVADLRGADLSDADLRGANLIDADLRGADLRGANLIDANLRGANLHGANLIDANLIDANLSGARGLSTSAEWLATFDADADGVRVYKRIGATRTQYALPARWVIEPGAVLTEVVNPCRTTECGCGVNFATREWCDAHYTDSALWLCRIAWIDLADVVVPYGTDGKARCARLTLLRVVPA